MSVEYPDISHYQAGLHLTGAHLVFAKATQGRSYTDPTYAGFKAQAKQLGVPFGAYHWLDTSDPVAQARHAFATVGAGVPLMIDDEQPPISVAHTLAFVAEYRRLGGLVVLEYLPRWTWSQSGSPDLRPLARAGLLLVASDYNPADNTTGGKAWQPYGGVSPTILQFTARRQFNGRAVDFNTYPGTLPQLLVLLNTNQGAIMALTDAQLLELARVAHNADQYGWALCSGLDAAPGIITSVGAAPKPFPNVVKQTLAQILDAVAKVQPAQATQDQVNTAVHAALSDPTIQQAIADRTAATLKSELAAILTAAASAAR